MQDKRYVRDRDSRLPSSYGYLTFSVPLCVCVVLLLITGKTFAHADLLSASPDIGETLTQSPEKIFLTFSDLIQSPSSIILFGKGFNQVELPDAVLSATILSVDLPKIEDGTYTVQWDVLSVDNDRVTGTYQFAVHSQRAIPELSGSMVAFLGIFSLITLVVIGNRWVSPIFMRKYSLKN